MGECQKEKIIFCWSGGKDSSLALYEIIKSEKFDITLLTTITQDYKRISMHGVRETLLDMQAESLGMPLEKIYISAESTNEEYEKKMRDALDRFNKLGVKRMAFGDIFLEDLRAYREKNMRKAGMEAIFPLWKRDTAKMAREFIGLGFKSIITCVDTSVLGQEFSGRLYNGDFLSDLPHQVDPCGENGEFHSFVFSGPIFKQDIAFKTGEKVLRNERFCFCDLLPV